MLWLLSSLIIHPSSDRLSLHGLLNLDKPVGMTSRDVVNRVSRLVRKTKIGHAGTLDPLATGVLIVCVGAATRLVDRIHEFPKGYRASLKLGVRSDTDDVTGTVTPGSDCSHITADDIEAALTPFIGTISQVPPKFSAVHVDGQRAYDKARSQQEFELAAKTVQIDSIDVIQHIGDVVDLDIVCGSGTYIRSLIRDVGDKLGCGAVMTSLRRTFIGPFRDADSLPLDQLTPETLSARLQPMNTILINDVKYAASQAECDALLQGKAIPIPPDFTPYESRIAVLDPTGELFAFATWDADKRTLQPNQVFVR